MGLAIYLVKQLQEAVNGLVRRILAAGTSLQGKLVFWGQPLLRDEETRDWRTRLEALKTFAEALAPYNTVGKLKNLRIVTGDSPPKSKILTCCPPWNACLNLSPS